MAEAGRAPRPEFPMPVEMRHQHSSWATKKLDDPMDSECSRAPKPGRKRHLLARKAFVLFEFAEVAPKRGFHRLMRTGNPSREFLRLDTGFQQVTGFSILHHQRKMFPSFFASRSRRRRFTKLRIKRARLVQQENTSTSDAFGSRPITDIISSSGSMYARCGINVE